jgi:GNAT superfamily N-acetyltransferase
LPLSRVRAEAPETWFACRRYAPGVGITVRRATEADRGTVVEMIGELQQAHPPEVRYRWLYVDNPGGPALTWLAIDDDRGEAAGLTSFFPFRLTVGRAALGGDGWVRPAFRRRGIGGALHAASRRDMATAGLACMYGAPGAMNVTPLLAGGSQRVGDIVRLVRPAPWPPLPGRTRLVPAVADDPRIDRVWAAAAPELAVAAVRDARFYTWRFVRSPSQQQRAFVAVGSGGEPIGACALEHIGGRVAIIDLLAPARDWGRCLRAIARHERGRALVMKLAAADAARRRLWLHGFIRREAKPFLVMPPEAGGARAVLDPARWFYTGADSDLDAAE